MSARPDPDAEQRVNPARVGEAAGEAAASSGATRSQTREEVRSAAHAADRRLTDAELDAIAERVITHLERRGAFETPAEPDDQGAGAPAAEATAGEREAAASSGEGPPPRKRTFAERFVGRQS